MVGFRYGWLDNIDNMQKEMGRLLDYLGTSKPPVARFDPEVWEPAIDVYETETEIAVLVEIAGLTPEDINVHIEGTTLAIRGERSDTPTNVKRSFRQVEIRRGFFERYVSLPVPVDPDRTRASYKDGLLEIVLVKSQKQESSKVRIRI
jgi:HSP20 family protein